MISTALCDVNGCFCLQIIALQEESQNLKQLNEDHEILRRDLESKSSSVAELEKEVANMISYLSHFELLTIHNYHVPFLTATKGQISSSGRHQDQGRCRTQVPTQDRRYGCTDG